MGHDEKFYYEEFEAKTGIHLYEKDGNYSRFFALPEFKDVEFILRIYNAHKARPDYYIGVDAPICNRIPLSIHQTVDKKITIPAHEMHTPNLKAIMQWAKYAYERYTASIKFYNERRALRYVEIQRLEKLGAQFNEEKTQGYIQSRLFRLTIDASDLSIPTLRIQEEFYNHEDNESYEEIFLKLKEAGF
jgi:hypothetical protein